LPKTLIFLNHDERWSNFREYCFDEENYGKYIVTLAFGIVISIICPFTFGLQNILLGLVLNGRMNKDIIRHVLSTTKTQLVVIYDTRLFYKNNKDDDGILGYGKMAAGYFLYVLPVGCIGYLFLFVYSTSFVCQDMKAPFLLDNSFKPAVNMTDLYLLRRQSCWDGWCDDGSQIGRTEYTMIKSFVRINVSWLPNYMHTFIS